MSFIVFFCSKQFEVLVWSSSHLALEAEDGDRKTHQSCDSQAQHHRLGVVKAGGSTNIYIFSFSLKRHGWFLHPQVYLPWQKSHHEGHAQSLSGKVDKNSLEAEAEWRLYYCIRFVFYTACYSQRELKELYSKETASCYDRKDSRFVIYAHRDTFYRVFAKEHLFSCFLNF